VAVLQALLVPHPPFRRFFFDAPVKKVRVHYSDKVHKFADESTISQKKWRQN